MEDQEKKHIHKNITELVDNTIWNTACLTVPMQTGVFGNDDVSFLESIADKRMRVLEFYRVFMTRHNSYQHLIATLGKAYQSGAVKILCGLDPTKYALHSEHQMSTSSANEVYETVQEIQQHDTAKPDSFTHQVKVSANGVQRESDKNGQTVQQPIANSEKSQSSVRFDIHNPTRLFTGRMKELSQLHEKLKQSKSKPAVVSQMASVAGLGGIGKTELARMYIQQNAEKEYDNNVIWISAESKETLTKSFQRLASDYLNLNQKNVHGKEKHQKTIIDEVYKYFEHKTCLFVFDNAESNADLQNFLPLQVPHPPFVLITSRDREWAFGVEILELNELKEIDAISLVKTALGIQDTAQDNIVVQLVKALQCFPLALSQAISYIMEHQILQNYSIVNYLEEYKFYSGKLLSRKIFPRALCNYTETTFTTWKLTTKNILSNKECGKHAIRMLNMVSYFQPDKIPVKLLLASKFEGPGMSSSTTVAKPYVSQSVSCNPEKNETALKLLVRFSMVNIQSSEQTISIHRLVQEVTRIELRRNKLEETTLRDGLQLLSKNLDIACINHLCSVYNNCKDYRNLVIDFKNAPRRIMKTLDSDDTSSRFLGVSVGNELNQTLQKHVSSGDVDVIKLECRIAVANYRVGNYEAAIKIFEQILPTYLKNTADLFTKEEVLYVQHYSSICLRRSGKQIEALKIMLQIYDSSKVVNGMNHWRTLRALLDIANCLREVGHFKKPFVRNAEYLQVLNQNLSIPKPLEIVSLLKTDYENNKRLISTDSNYSRCMFSMAKFFYDIGDNDTAGTIANDVYEKGKILNHTKIQRDSMSRLNLLAELKRREGKPEEALEIYKEVHTFSSQALGSSHRNTLRYKRNMLTKVRDFGQHEAALVGFRDVLEALMKNYPNHPDVFWTEYSIGISLFKLERYEESLALLVNLRTRIEDRFGLTDLLLPNVNKWIERAQKFVFN